MTVLLAKAPLVMLHDRPDLDIGEALSDVPRG